MTLFHISMLTLVATVALIIISQFARRNADPSAKIHLYRKVLTVIVLVLAGIYFYMRFAGS